MPDDTFLLSEFEIEVGIYADQIDPNQEIDWVDMATGWFLAKGCLFWHARQLARRSQSFG